MRFGLNPPPQQRVYGGFFTYSFRMGSLLSLIFADALGKKPLRHEVD